MIILGAIEVPAGLDPDDDRSIEHVRLVELGDIRLGDARLFCVLWGRLPSDTESRRRGLGG